MPEMTMQEYYRFVPTTAVYPFANSGDVPELMYLSLGLAGEAGEMTNHIKKLWRDGDSVAKREQAIAELGDIFWYLFQLCHALNVNPQQIMEDNAVKLTSRLVRGKLHGDGDLR